MLVSRDELKFDFQGAQFDLKVETDRKFLGWIFNQFLYGEATGIQCGYWLYRAPTMNAASFLAKQAGEELSHFRKILRIITLLDEKPTKAHWAIRFLASGMMGNSWGEHVTLEMALGEGLVLTGFYAMTDTISHPEIHRILDSASQEEERHVTFGERETTDWLKAHPHSRKLLLTQALVQAWVLKKLKNFIVQKISLEFLPSHPVMKHFEAFYDHSIHCFELRIERLGLSQVPIRELSIWSKMMLLVALPGRVMIKKFKPKSPLLTVTYLKDPSVLSEIKRFPLSSRVHE